MIPPLTIVSCEIPPRVSGIKGDHSFFEFCHGGYAVAKLVDVITSIADSCSFETGLELARSPRDMSRVSALYHLWVFSPRICFWLK